MTLGKDTLVLDIYLICCGLVVSFLCYCRSMRYSPTDQRKDNFHPHEHTYAAPTKG